MTDTQQLFRLDGQAAIVTGGGRGLGRAMAVALAQSGADCVLVARRADDLAESVRAVQAAAPGRRAVAVAGDVSDEAVAQAAVAAALKHFGRLDILINNAGRYHMQPIEETSLADWRGVLDVNLVGPFLFCKAAAAHFKRQRRGKVVNVASILAIKGMAGATAYCASKAGVAQFTASLAVEWAPHGLHVNAIAPGLFETDMSKGVFDNAELHKLIMAGIPRGVHGRPEDLAGTVVYLCSAASDHMLGQVLYVDGGASIA